MKSLIALLQKVLNDMGTLCGTSTGRDLKEITVRVEHEGISFLTISLANFGKDFEKSLDQGFVDSASFLGFKRRAGLPLLFEGFLSRVFNTGDGRLLENPCVDSIFAVRQVSLMFAKMDLPCSRERTRKALHGYLECEKDVRTSDAVFASELDLRENFARIGRLLWAELFTAVDTRIYKDEFFIPKHGPGATADKLRGNAKYNQRTWTSRLDKVFPHWDYLAPSDHPFWVDRLRDVTILEPGKEIPVKVITVPKTLKTPRIIAVEPTCMQYMQQGVLAMIVKQIPRSDKARNFICFESQQPNQRLAREGSITGDLATLDLSEASDRVSNEHVRLLLENHPWLAKAVDSTRSRKAHVFDEDLRIDKTIRLAKFASMGSALCFPFEAIVFTTVIFIGIEKELKRRLTEKDVKSFFGKVRVYGDDIIVPVDYVQSVVRELEAFGFKVNRNKSFYRGRFRESCGRDYYAGRDVSIVKLRRHLPFNRQQTEEVGSTVSLRNQLFHKGVFPETVDHLDDILEKVIPFPFVRWSRTETDIHQPSPLLGRHGYAGPSQAQRHDRDLHIPLVKGVVLVPQKRVSKLDDYGALLKCFHLMEGSPEPSEDDEHLQFAGRPVSVRMKTRYAQP